MAIVKNQLNIEFNRIKKIDIINIFRQINLQKKNDRICIAIRTENKNLIKGITVGKSDSGSTVFIEPESMIELNEKYIDLVSDERLEINKIISLLTFELQKKLYKTQTKCRDNCVYRFEYSKSQVCKIK